MAEEYFNLHSDDMEAFIRDRLSEASSENVELDLLFEFCHGPVIAQLNRLQLILRAIGRRAKFVGLLMMAAMNMEKVHQETITAIDRSCPNLKKFYAAGLFIRCNKFNEKILKPFFGRLEDINLQMGEFEGTNTFAVCKKLKEWSLEIFYGFSGGCLNFQFPELRSIAFSKVDDIDNEHLEPFLSKNPQLKSMILTRCTIDSNILKMIAKHVPAIEELAFNFRRSLDQGVCMQRDMKHLLKLEHLKALNLDCIGHPIGDILVKMSEKNIPLERVGLFCCPWDENLVKALGALKGLKSLHLTNMTKFNDERLGQLSQSLSELNDLTLKFIPNITVDGVFNLLVACQRVSTATLCLPRLTTISTSRYNLLLEAIKNRPEKIKLTIVLWASKSPLKLLNDLLKKNLEFLEIHSEKEELNKNIDFDFFCNSEDGGYDLVAYSSSQVAAQSCRVN